LIISQKGLLSIAELLPSIVIWPEGIAKGLLNGQKVLLRVGD
jgi:hypothetical protein